MDDVLGNVINKNFHKKGANPVINADSNVDN